MTKDLRLKLYPAVIAILGLSLLALMLSRVEIQVSSEAPIDGLSRVDEPQDSIPAAPDARPALPSVPPSPSPSVLPSPRPNPQAAASPTPASPVSAEGGLRISNQTIYPVRVALLPQQSEPQQSEPQQSDPSSEPTRLPSSTASSLSRIYSQPVHWDFSPEEGRAKGLMLSLPDQNLRLQPGDVLVAFAQDGSRRYWGPYVVGKTPSPEWIAEQKEWSLILQP